MRILSLDETNAITGNWLVLPEPSPTLPLAMGSLLLMRLSRRRRHEA